MEMCNEQRKHKRKENEEVIKGTNERTNVRTMKRNNKTRQTLKLKQFRAFVRANGVVGVRLPFGKWCQVDVGDDKAYTRAPNTNTSTDQRKNDRATERPSKKKFFVFILFLLLLLLLVSIRVFFMKQNWPL